MVVAGAMVATLVYEGHGVGEIETMAMKEGVDCIVVN